jgi:hypothetical protein
VSSEIEKAQPGDAEVFEEAFFEKLSFQRLNLRRRHFASVRHESPLNFPATLGQ